MVDFRFGSSLGYGKSGFGVTSLVCTYLPVLEQELRSPVYQKMGWVVIRFDFIGNEIDF